MRRAYPLNGFFLLLALLGSSCGRSSRFHFDDDRIPVKIGDEWGFASPDGNLVIPARFRMVSPFSDGLAKAEDKGWWGFVTRDGEYRISPKYTGAGFFSCGLAFVTEEDSVITAIDVSGQMKFRLDSVICARPFREDRAVIRSENGWGAADLHGQTAIECMYERLGDFHEGLAFFLDQEADPRVGFLDRKGEVIIAPQFEEAFSFHDGFAAARSGGKWGFVNRKGNWVIFPLYDEVLDFSEGYAAVRKNERWGFVDADGREVTAFSFMGAGSFHQGLAAALSGSGYWGYCNTAGEYVIQPQFRACGPFRSGLAWVAFDDHYGFIGTNGSFRIAPHWDEVYAADDEEAFNDPRNHVYSDLFDYGDFWNVFLSGTDSLSFRSVNAGTRAAELSLRYGNDLVFTPPAAWFIRKSQDVAAMAEIGNQRFDFAAPDSQRVSSSPALNHIRLLMRLKGKSSGLAPKFIRRGMAEVMKRSAGTMQPDEAGYVIRTQGYTLKIFSEFGMRRNSIVWEISFGPDIHRKAVRIQTPARMLKRL